MPRQYTFAPVALGAALMAASTLASAQSSVTLYGTVDRYLNYMHSSSGRTIKDTQDGAYLRSRWGLRGTEDLGDGLVAKFQMEGGLNSGTGGNADSTRMFDRQAWLGIASPTWGEVRFGRQNGVVFYRGDYIDYGSRTLGSIVNTFGVPSRYDNDFSYLSPRIGGLQGEAHVAIAQSTAGALSQAVYQYGLDYVTGPYRVGYAGLRAKAPSGAAVPNDVFYDNLYANYDHGNGKVYLVYVRSNNNTSTAVSNNAGTILGNVGGVVAGTNTDAKNSYGIWQVSADYRVAPLLRVGALWGSIHDNSGRGRGATGGSIGAFYDLSKRTTLYGLVDTIRNDTNGGFRPAGSAGLSFNFSSPAEINGRTINGIQTGIVHRF